ncbi:MalY/PatB family protein [Paludibacterium yongneupense]|uniref:MalY/PatB family protein n=1 Tax=Paludibacterium yongneupense TaxID=400061 RepID=UPI000491EA4E|nr:aminotransferase class I/II-fold pyridoxal phosphate-dependent enzyme [Paludibacterium yongneupense]
MTDELVPGRELAALRALQSDKWRRFGPDVLPAHVAEMDYPVAAPIRAALAGRISRQDYGYPLPGGRDGGRLLAEAFAQRMADRFDWSPDPALVIPMGDLVQGLYACVLAFSDPGDGVIVLMPSYPKIREAVTANARRLLALTLRDDGERFAFDPAELEALASDRARLLIICNPHNPTGRVFSRAELRALGECAERHNLIVLVDEVHADLVYTGARHLSFAGLDPAFAVRSVTLNSATKSFNIPGLRCAVAAFGDRALLQRFSQRIPPRVLGDPNVFGLDATLAAWQDGQPWLAAVLTELEAARDRVVTVLRAAAPAIRIRAPEATYLAWLDCSGLELPVTASDYFLRAAGVALSPGQAFIPGGSACVRLNFATSPTLLEHILQRMLDALTRG